VGIALPSLLIAPLMAPPFTQAPHQGAGIHPAIPTTPWRSTSWQEPLERQLALGAEASWRGNHAAALEGKSAS